MAAPRKKSTASSASKKKKTISHPHASQKVPENNFSELLGWGLIGLGLVALIVLLPLSSPNNTFRLLLQGIAGCMGFVPPLLLIWVGLLIAFSGKRQYDVGRIGMIAGCVLLIFSMIHIFSADQVISHLRIKGGWLNFITQSFVDRVGTGAIGAVIAYPAYVMGCGQWGGFVILLFVLLGLFFVMKNISLRQFGEKAQKYISTSYSDFKETQSVRSAERAVVRAERAQTRRAATEERRAAQERVRAQQQEWEVSWDDLTYGNTETNASSRSVSSRAAASVMPQEEDDFNISVAEESGFAIPDYMKNRQKRKKPILGQAQPACSEEAAPEAETFFARSNSHTASEAEMPLEETNAAPCQTMDFEADDEDAPFDTEYFSPTNNPFDVPIEDEADDFETSDDVCNPFEEDEDDEPVDLPVSGLVFPRLNAVDEPVQRERRRPVLGERVKPADASAQQSPSAPRPILQPTNAAPRATSISPATKPNSITPVTPDETADGYNYPPVDLLALPSHKKEADREIRDKAKANKLEATLHDFGISAQLTGIAHGPAVTRFELAPAPGVRVNRITSLSDDIALSLAARSIRIEAPIPGKAAVGVEIPNDVVETVPLREVLESNEARKHPSRLAIALGKDNSGKHIVGDIAKMPHVLIAGATGSGKSVCINCIICSILYRASPDEVRLIMIDPKMVELSIYNGIPHLLVPVVTDPKKASGALQWAVTEMTARYNKFAERGVRDMKGYNQTCTAEEKPMPQIVIIIDELADLMMVCPGEVEDSICRLAQLARAAGIHLVIATQRPSVNVITGVIKANIPARIAFTVASSVDSRTILDSGGAEKLLGRGDMLFAPAGNNSMQRVQGAWVSDEEVHAIVDYIKERHDAEYSADIIEQMNRNDDSAETESEEPAAEGDPLLQQAVEIAVEAGQASISMLQRRLRIGYARAGRLIDEMTARGIISQSEGAKPRNVLITREQYNMMFGSMIS